jgi:phosphoribosylaminoimidazole-succinocarboxamide synthase
MNLPLPPERPLPDRLSRWQAVRVTDLPLELPGYEHIYSGKVRDLYAPVGDDGQVVEDRLLLVASNRLSAYDWMMSPEIPDKGEVLTRLSLWWFDQLADLVPHHVVSTDVPDEVRGRAVICRRLEMFPVECVARGYLTGGGLKDYEKTGAVSGVTLPPGLVDGAQLPEPIFTPSTKAPLGQHDEPMTFAEVEDLVGARTAARLRDLTLAVYARGAETAAASGILVADTKLEFGHDPATGEIVLADEVLTPDSSRFWPAERWEPGHPQPSFDKQFVRDWSATLDWDRTPPGPEVPPEIVAATRARYVEAYERLTARRWA